MTSSNGNIFRVNGPLCGKFTDHKWISLTKVSDAEFWCFFMCAWINGREAGDLRRHRAHYDVTVMEAQDLSILYFVRAFCICVINDQNNSRQYFMISMSFILGNGIFMRNIILLWMFLIGQFHAIVRLTWYWTGYFDTGQIILVFSCRLYFRADLFHVLLCLVPILPLACNITGTSHGRHGVSNYRQFDFSLFVQ